MHIENDSTVHWELILTLAEQKNWSKVFRAIPLKCHFVGVILEFLVSTCFNDHDATANKCKGEVFILLTAALATLQRISIKLSGDISRHRSTEDEPCWK